MVGVPSGAIQFGVPHRHVLGSLLSEGYWVLRLHSRVRYSGGTASVSHTPFAESRHL